MIVTKKSSRRLVVMLLSSAAASVVLAQDPSAKTAKPAPLNLSGVYTLAGHTEKSAGKTYSSDKADVSAIYVKNNGDLALTDPAITTTGESSSQDNSNAFGLNAAVLNARGKVKITGGSITTSGAGASAIYSIGNGSTVAVSKTTIITTGAGGRGVTASAAGVVALSDVDISTSGASAPAIAIDKGGGNIAVTGGNVATSGDKSPAVFSTGIIKISNATLNATGAEAVMIDGHASVTLQDTKLTGGKSHGVMLYQSGTKETVGNNGTFTMNGGSITAGDGPLFFVTNTTASINVTGVALNASSGTLVKSAADEWGTTGANAGTVTFTASRETLTGDLSAGSPSTIAAKLQDKSTLTGTIKGAALALDNGSSWTLTADSEITALVDTQGAPERSFTNIIGNGHDATYDASLTANSWLGGKIYKLYNGGHLKPAEGTVAKNNGNNPNNPNNGQGYPGYNGRGGHH